MRRLVLRLSIMPRTLVTNPATRPTRFGCYTVSVLARTVPGTIFNDVAKMKVVNSGRENQSVDCSAPSRGGRPDDCTYGRYLWGKRWQIFYWLNTVIGDLYEMKDLRAGTGNGEKGNGGVIS